MLSEAQLLVGLYLKVQTPVYHGPSVRGPPQVPKVAPYQLVAGAAALL